MQNKEQIAKLQQAYQEIMKHKAQFCEIIQKYDNSESFSESVLKQLETITSLSRQVSVFVGGFVVSLRDFLFRSC